MLHRDLILSSNPIAYYPLDKDKLNEADTSKFAGAGSTTYDGSSETSPGVFFKGQPIVKGLRNACHIKNSSSYITIPNHGFFAKLGENRSMSLELYHMFDSYSSRVDGVIMKLGSTSEFELGVNYGTYYLTVKPGSDTEQKTVSVYSGQINRPKQIVINWAPDWVNIVVDGNVSDKIDTSGMSWTDTSGLLRLYGVGSSSGTYKRFNLFNSLTIFGYQLTKSKIDELRAAAWGPDNVYTAVKAYNGDFISCFGGNIKKNGQFNLTERDDWYKATLSEVSTPTNNEIGYPQFRLPTYTNPQTPIYANSRVLIPTDDESYIDYTTGGDVVGARAIGIRAANKGTGNYTSKQYILTAQSGTRYLGIYAQSQNAYYEYIDSLNGESLSGTIATAIDGYSSTGTFFAGIDRESNEILFGSASGDFYDGFYSGLSKVSFSRLGSFFSGAQFRFGADIRSESQAYPFNGNIYAITFGFNDVLSKMTFKYGMPSQNGYPIGFYVDSTARFNYDIPANMISDWDGATTEPGSISLYYEGDTNGPATIELEHATSLGGSWTSTSGLGSGVTNSRVAKIADGTNVNSYIYRIAVSYKMVGAPHIKNKIDKIELNSYSSTAGIMSLVDGRSSRSIELNKYCAVAPDNVQAHGRGPNDGIRIGSGTSGAGVQTTLTASTKNAYGIAFALWVDSSSSDYELITGDFTSKNILTVTYASGFSLTATAPTSTVFQGVNLIPSTSTFGRLYINGEYIAYTGTTPNTQGKLKTNCWNHIFIAFGTASSGNADVAFGPAAGSLPTSFDDTICINDIAIFEDDSFPTTNANKDMMASHLAAPYFGNAVSSNGTQGSLYTLSGDTVTIKSADGRSVETDRQWRPLS